MVEWEIGAVNTLQPTARVHEAYVRLVDQTAEPEWSHRGHFFAAANEQSIFLGALERPGGELRNKWLDDACGGDVALRARIDALIQRHQEAGSFLEKVPAEMEAPRAGSGTQ